jgi:uncharacterized protein YndB with AHSA1/START domain
MGENLIAKASTLIDAPIDKVWTALITPESIKQYMFGTTVASEWREGSPITWKGEWEGKPYEDKGVILKLQPQRTLEYSHFSPLMGRPDKPENYHRVKIDLSRAGDQTRVDLAQDNNLTEEARAHSEKNWNMMLAAMKDFLEK